MTRPILAIDPGDVHVGLAAFYPEGDSWECVLAWEMTPDEFITWYLIWCHEGVYSTTVCELFRLYPDKAMQQTGSTMPTCELIGQIKLVSQMLDQELVLQPAAIQEPTAGVLRNRGIKSTARASRAGQHARSAELHGWHYILRTLEA